MIDPTSDPDITYRRRERGTGSRLSDFEQELLRFIADAGRPVDTHAATKAMLSPTGAISDIRWRTGRVFGAACFLVQRGLLERIHADDKALATFRVTPRGLMFLGRPARKGGR